MSSASRAFKRLALSWLLAGIAPAIWAQNAYSPQGEEFPIAGSLPGDQVYPHVAVGTNGGYLAWQDNVTDGDGWGISARRINSSLGGSFGVFRVNEQGGGDQENVRVALLKDGGAVFVWQGGTNGFQHIYARFLKSDGTFAGGDRMVNTYTNNHQINPNVAVLGDGTVAIVWSSYGQDGDLYGVYAQRFTALGGGIGGEFQVNQTPSLSQRTPSLAALPDGGFAVAWVAERTTTTSLRTATAVVSNSPPRYTADIMGRLFNANGDTRGGEFRVSTSEDPCANPAMAVSANGGFVVAWSQKGSMATTNSWDVFARCYDSNVAPVSSDL